MVTLLQQDLVIKFLKKGNTSLPTEYYDTPGTASGLPKYYGNWDAQQALSNQRVLLILH